MSALSQESIKHLTKSELKAELTKRGLPLKGRKDGLQKQKHKEDINELWKDNYHLCERLRDLEDRSRRDNLRIDGIAEMENETWEQTEEILQNLFEEKLQLETISVERAHRVGNKVKNKKRTIVVKLASFKDKLKIISEAQKQKVPP